MGKKRQPKVAMIMGDAAGIGPEIVAKSLNTEETRHICIPAVIGAFQAALRIAVRMALGPK